MIMLVTHQLELRKQLSRTLEASGHPVTIPPHRGDMVNTFKKFKPNLIVLDLYVDSPSGVQDLKALRAEGYNGNIIVLSGPSMMPVLKEAYPCGIESIVQVPAKINGQYQLGDLQSSIAMCLKSRQYTLIAKRAYELYESGGCQDGRDLDNWLQAEHEIAMHETN